MKKNFNPLLLKCKLRGFRKWTNRHHISPKVTFWLLGIASTVWFLLRVIPKPSRATYACMRVTAPIMSGFVVYLLSIGGVTMAFRKIKYNLIHSKYIAAGSFFLAAIIGIFFAVYDGSEVAYSQLTGKTGPDDGPNQPFGVEKGVNPGRVIWAWDQNATNENTTTYFWENTNNELVYKMFHESVLKLTSENTSKKAWDAIFKNFNKEKNGVAKGYTKGEKIFIKINQTTARGTLKPEDIANGYALPAPTEQTYGACETGPAVVLALLKQLVNEAGVAQEDIFIADPQNPTFKHNADAWWAEFPNVKIGSKMSADFGRTLLVPSETELFFTSDKKIREKFYTVTESANYMINVANLKPHRGAGITLTAKNHFGTHTRDRSSHFHVYLPMMSRKVVNGGYGKYRILTDIMGSKYLGRNTLICIVDGLFAGGASETGEPVKYFMSPFNNDWCNSLFLSIDQVAIESVCYDFLRTEWDGVHQHDPRNNNTEYAPSVNGVDDYLHQAADSKRWPEGIVYDPDNSGMPIPSLGVHEHWNNADKKQYSRNLGKKYGIELISIPEKLVGDGY